MINQNTKLINLIRQYPDAEIRICANEYDMEFDNTYSSILIPISDVMVEELAYCNDTEELLNRDDLFDRVAEFLFESDEEKYDPSNISDEEFDELVRKYIEENYEFKTYIIIHI